MNIVTSTRCLATAFALAVPLIATDINTVSANNLWDAGDQTPDGTIFITDNLRAMPEDAPGLHTWDGGQAYCGDLVSHGHDDWRLPYLSEHAAMFYAQNKGALKGTFKNTFEDGDAASYWTADTDQSQKRSEYWNYRGRMGSAPVDFNYSVRCIREPS